jgi:hypothetical protein
MGLVVALLESLYRGSKADGGSCDWRDWDSARRRASAWRASYSALLMASSCSMRYSSSMAADERAVKGRIDDCIWRGDRHKSQLLLDEHKIRPDDDNMNLTKWNENKNNYLVITVSTTFCLFLHPKCRLIVRRWPHVSWTGKPSKRKVIWHWKISLNFWRSFRRYRWMEKVRMVIAVYTRVTSEFVWAGKAFFARGISTDETCMRPYVSGLGAW